MLPRLFLSYNKTNENKEPSFADAIYEMTLGSAEPNASDERKHDKI